LKTVYPNFPIRQKTTTKKFCVVDAVWRIDGPESEPDEIFDRRRNGRFKNDVGLQKIGESDVKKRRRRKEIRGGDGLC
jgi:hypothetical protein